MHQSADGEERQNCQMTIRLKISRLEQKEKSLAETVEGYAASPASQEVTIEDSDVTITFCILHR